MLIRKRTWYSVKDHLTNYGDVEENHSAVSELVENGFLMTVDDLHTNLVNQFKSNQNEISSTNDQETFDD